MSTVNTEPPLTVRTEPPRAVRGEPPAAIRTTCPYCGVGCGVLATPEGAVSGDPAHPANAGRLCSKGTALGETLGLEDRLLHPEVNGKRASWNGALDAVAAGFAAALRDRGPDSTALYVSGQLLTEDYYAANKFAKGVLGTANIDSNSRLCMASAVAAHTRAFGEDVVPVTYADVEQADLVVLVGSNLAWCHPVLFQRLRAANRPYVVIDPRRTATCEGAVNHLPLAPGSDVALFAALLVHLADHGHARGDAAGAEAAIAAARPVAAQAAALTGLPQHDVDAFCALWAATPRVVTLWSQGVNQSGAGTDKANAIINAHLLTGRIGKPGAGPFSITGQPNAMGGREVGALATMLAGHLRFDVAAERDALAAFWGAASLPTGHGLKAVDLFAAVAAQKIGALWIMATNPAVSLPDAARVRAALAATPFVVLSETTRRSDTPAHVRLPALAWGEKDGTVTNSERVISRQRAFRPAPGEARPDWWIIAEVARRLGAGDRFAWDGPAAIFREHAAVTALARPSARMLDLSAIAAADYETMPPTRWGPRHAFPDGAGARLVPTPFRDTGHAPDAHFPLRLNTGRLRDQWHTMTRTGTVPRLMAHAPEPTLTLHPDDASDLEAGALVCATTPFGSAVLRLARDHGQQRGSGFAPMHWTAQFAPAARINDAVNPVVDPISGQPELKHTPLAVAAFAACWHGFVLAPRRLEATAASWGAAIPLAAGFWRHELAGDEPAPAAFSALRAAIGEHGVWTELADPACGIHRAALIVEGVLRAVIYVGPDHALPARDWLCARLGLAVDAATRRALLAGALPGGPPPSPLVCVCHGVTAATIARCGARDVVGVGVATAAGTGCGSCRPEIAALLAQRVAA